MIWDPTETTPGREIRFYSREHQEANYRPFMNVLCAPGSGGWNGGGGSTGEGSTGGGSTGGGSTGEGSTGGGSTGGGGGGGGGEEPLPIDV